MGKAAALFHSRIRSRPAFIADRHLWRASPNQPAEHTLPASPYYLEAVVTSLKKSGLLRTYYRDRLRGYRLGAKAKAALLDGWPERFSSYRRYTDSQPPHERGKSAAPALPPPRKPMSRWNNAGIGLFQDEKKRSFAPQGSIPVKGKTIQIQYCTVHTAVRHTICGARSCTEISGSHNPPGSCVAERREQASQKLFNAINILLQLPSAKKEPAKVLRTR